MMERIDIAKKRAIQQYKDAYEYEFDNKEDFDLTDEQFEFAEDLRNHIRELYWIVNGDSVKVKFDKSKITIKYSNGTTREY